MKLSIFALLTLTFACHAFGADHLTFKHVHYKAQDAHDKKILGDFDMDFVTLSAAKGEKMTLNQVKVDSLMRRAAEASTCGADMNDGEDRSNQSSSISTNVTFISGRLIALSQGFESDCGGAHPDFGSSSTIYDFNTAQAIDIRTGQPENFEVEPTAEQKKIDAVILKAMKAQAKKEIAARGAHDCDDEYKQLSFMASDITLTPKLLIVQNQESHASMACQFATNIPLELFSNVAPKGSLLAELAAGAAKLKK